MVRGDDLSIIASLLSDLLALHRTDSALLPLLMFSLLDHDEQAIELLQKLRSRVEQSVNLSVELNHPELDPCVSITQ